MAKITEFAVSELGTYCLHPVWYPTAAAAQAEIDKLPDPSLYHVIEISYDDPGPLMLERAAAVYGKAVRDEKARFKVIDDSAVQESDKDALRADHEARLITLKADYDVALIRIKARLARENV